jgi:23S rRNA (cytosine1962-C5)-methyltransferase
VETISRRVGPGCADRLDRFLVAQVPGLGRKAAKALVEGGAARVDGHIEKRASFLLREGMEVALRYRPSRLPLPALDGTCVLARGDGWIAIDKPSGVPTHRTGPDGPGVPELLGPEIGRSPDALWPAHRLDRGTSGVLLLATDRQTLSELSRAFEARSVAKTYLARVDRWQGPDERTLREVWPEGEVHLDVRVVHRGADIELEVRPREGRTHQIRRQLAAVGSPIRGDVRYGGAAASRLMLHCGRVAWGCQQVEAPIPPGWGIVPPPTPRRVAAPRPAATSNLPALRVSPATARILRLGHPWVLRDARTGSLDGIEPGAAIRLIDPGGAELAVALADPRSPRCARVAGPAGAELDGDVLHDRLLRAIDKRVSRLPPRTDAFRLAHGEADGLPGLRVDIWGVTIVLTHTSECLVRWEHALLDAVAKRFPDAPVFSHRHDPWSAKGDAADPRGRWLRGGGEASVMVEEAGLRYLAFPLDGVATGFYPDQRENRAALAARVHGRSLLNLFAHTGAFSVSAARGGARRTVSVDLSPRWCGQARDNLVRNGFDLGDHEVVAAPVERFLRERQDRFDFAVIDPPSFSTGRRDGPWNANRDLGPLLEAVLLRIEPGGSVLVCINRLSTAKEFLAETAREALRRAARRGQLHPAPPSFDFPRKRGFPEGDTFQGVFIDVA